MKLKLLFFALSFFFLHSLAGQETFAEFKPNEKVGGKPTINSLLVAHHDDGGMSICYYFSSRVYIYNLDATGKTISQGTLPTGQNKLFTRGVLQTEESTLFVFYDGMEKKIKIIETNKGEDISPQLLTLETKEKKEKHIGLIASNNELYILSWNKKGEYINLGRFNKKTKMFDRKNYQLNRTLGNMLVQKGGIQAISDATLPEPSKAKGLNKIYLSGKDEIIITSEGKMGSQGMTQILKLSWNKNKIEQRLLGGASMNTGGYLSSNSYFRKGLLSRVSMNSYGLNIQVFDLSDMSEKMVYRFSKEDTLSIMNSRLYVESDNIWQGNRTFSKGETKKVLKKLSKGIPFIFSEPTENGNWVYTIGNYIIQTSGGGYTPGMPGSTISTPGGNVATAGTPGSWSYGSSYKTSRYFYSILEKNTLEHMEGKALEENFLSRNLQKFVDTYLTKEATLFPSFSKNYVYRISLIPGTFNQATVVSYLRKEGIIRVHKFDLGKME